MAATATHLGALTGAVLVMGLFVGPALVTVNTVAARLVPADRGAFLMALLNSGVVLGVAAGASLGGAFAEHAGPAAGVRRRRGGRRAARGDRRGGPAQAVSLRR